MGAKLIQANRHTTGRKDGRTDTTKLKGAFGDYANVPENSENHFPRLRMHCGLVLSGECVVSIHTLALVLRVAGAEPRCVRQ